MPATFVNIDNLYQTSTFGRVCAEDLANELKRRGFDVVEIRRSQDLMISRRSGELALSRDSAELFESYQANALLVGTYALTAQQVWLSVRLVRAADNRLVAVGSAVFDREGNLFLNSLLLKESSAGGPEARRTRVKVGVTSQFLPAQITEETIGPEPPSPPGEKK